MVCLNRRDGDATAVRDHGRDVHRERMHPFAVDAEHVHDEIGGAFRAVDRPALPITREISVVIRMGMSTRASQHSITSSKGGTNVKKYAVTPGIEP